MKPTPLHRPRELLLVADDPADVAVVRNALAGPGCRLTAALGVAEALALLSAEDPRGLRPDLVLLLPGPVADSALPILTALKSDPRRRLVPVVVVLPNSTGADVIHEYQRQANCCLRRPSDGAEFVPLLGEIEGFWLKLALLPPVD